MDNTYNFAPANFSNYTFSDDINTDNTIYQLDNCIMVDTNTKFIQTDNKYNELLLIKKDLLKYINHDTGELNEELEVEDDKKEDIDDSTNTLNSALVDFYKEFLVKQTLLIDTEKALRKEIEKFKKDIKLIDSMLEQLQELSMDYFENKEIVDNILVLGKTIQKKTNIKKIKEEYVKCRKDMNIYLDIIRNINGLNLGSTCSMCMNSNVDVYFSGCGHTSCQECADRLVEYDGGIHTAKCSYCRKHIDKLNKLYYL